MRFLIAALLLSCAPHVLDIPKSNLKREWSFLKDITNEAYNFLSTCPYFLTNYPEKEKELKRKKKIEIVYHDVSGKVAYFNKKTPDKIFVTNLFFSLKDPWRMQAAIAHEMLHMIGLPDHVGDMQDEQLRREDPIYKTIRYCFPLSKLGYNMGLSIFRGW